MEVKKILLVDDDDDIRKVAGISLVKIGKFELLTAACGEEGLHIAEAEKPDMIILDMNMPGMDGLEVLEKLRENPATASIPVMFMTAKTQARDKEDYMARGACGVIEKPFDPMSISNEIRKIAAGI
jgi:CheY-like chemotaxis protein